MSKPYAVNVRLYLRPPPKIAFFGGGGCRRSKYLLKLKSDWPENFFGDFLLYFWLKKFFSGYVEISTALYWPTNINFFVIFGPFLAIFGILSTLFIISFVFHRREIPNTLFESWDVILFENKIFGTCRIFYVCVCACNSLQ